MFFFQSRRADPVALTEEFTPEENDRISRLHRQFHTYPACFKLDINYRRLEFARWLVDHGYLGEWRDTQAELVGELESLREQGRAECYG